MDVTEMCRTLKQRVRDLNHIAGEIGEGRRTALTSRELQDARALADLARSVGVVDQVVLKGEVGGTWDSIDKLLPSRFVEAYGLLWDKAYGSRTTQGLGDETAIHGAGQRQTRISSGKENTRAGAITKKDKSKRNIVKDGEAFQLKRRIDSRLNRMAADVGLFLDGGRDGLSNTTVMCARCTHICATDWKFCASCGAAMRSEDNYRD